MAKDLSHIPQALRNLCSLVRHNPEDLFPAEVPGDAAIGILREVITSPTVITNRTVQDAAARRPERVIKPRRSIYGDAQEMRLDEVSDFDNLAVLCRRVATERRHLQNAMRDITDRQVQLEAALDALGVAVLQ